MEHIAIPVTKSWLKATTVEYAGRELKTVGFPRGDQAKKIAQGFHQFLPDVVDDVDPFISENIDKGTHWSNVLTGSLNESPCAIVCLTPDSIKSTWVAFETGAVSRAAGGLDGAKSRIWTYLTGLETTDLQLTPFDGYQATRLTKKDTLRLIRSINGLSPRPNKDDRLLKRVERESWPDFEKVLEEACRLTSKPPAPPVDQVATLSDILQAVRAVREGIRLLSSVPASTVAPDLAAQVDEHAGEEELTSKEIDVLRLIAAGKANKEIAAQLSMTEDTIKRFVTNILSKLGANDRTHAVTVGLKRGIIEL